MVSKTARKPVTRKRTKKLVPVKRKNPLFMPVKAVEQKNIDVGLVAQALTANSFNTVNACNIIVPGDTGIDREGRKVVLKSFLMRYSCTNASTAGSCQFRILVVYDKQTNGAAPAVTDILTVNDFLGNMNLANTTRFVVIADVVTEPLSLATNVVSGMIYRKLNLETLFGTGGGTVADINSGGVFFIIAPNSTVAAASVFSAKTRIRFIDL